MAAKKQVDPVVLLAQFMLANDLNKWGLAQRLGIHHSSVGRILARTQHPSEETQGVIERETGIKKPLWGKRLRRDSKAALRALAGGRAA